MFSMPASPAKDYEFESQTAIDISKKKNFKKKGVWVSNYSDFLFNWLSQVYNINNSQSNYLYSSIFYE